MPKLIDCVSKISVAKRNFTPNPENIKRILNSPISERQFIPIESGNTFKNKGLAKFLQTLSEKQIIPIELFNKKNPAKTNTLEYFTQNILKRPILPMETNIKPPITKTKMNLKDAIELLVNLKFHP